VAPVRRANAVARRMARADVAMMGLRVVLSFAFGASLRLRGNRLKG